MKSHCQTDAEYLHQRLASIGERLYADTLHDFIERVGIKTDSDINDDDARNEAFEEMFK